MSWKEKWTFIKPKSVEHEVEGQMLKFYPVSMSSLFTIKTIAAPIARALATIFQSEDNDVGITDRTIGDGQMNGDFTTEKIIEPISMDLARFRLDQKQRAIEDAVNTLFDPANSRVIMRLVMDSLRDDFDRKQNEDEKNKEADRVLETIDGSQFRELLTGLYLGNKKVFGPLADTVAQWKDLLGRRVRDLAGKIEDAPEESPDAEGEEMETDQETITG